MLSPKLLFKGKGDVGVAGMGGSEDTGHEGQSLTQPMFLTVVEEEVEMEISHCSVAEIGFLETQRLGRH